MRAFDDDDTVAVPVAGSDTYVKPVAGWPTQQ